MNYSVFECLYFEVSFLDILNCRLVCNLWKDMLTNLFENTAEECSNWHGYVNILHVSSLFPNIQSFKRMCHNGLLVNYSIISKICNLSISQYSYIDKDVSSASNNIKSLTLTFKTDLSLLNTVSEIEWTHLEKLFFITESITLRGITQLQLNWKVPALKKILIGCSCEFFPLAMSALPLHDINTCIITSNIELSTHKVVPHPIWQAHFMRNWSYIIESNITQIDLYNVIPLHVHCISMLIQGLKSSKIQKMSLYPCEPTHACYILNETDVRLFVKASSVYARWIILQNVFESRICFVSENIAFKM